MALPFSGHTDIRIIVGSKPFPGKSRTGFLECKVLMRSENRRAQTGQATDEGSSYYSLWVWGFHPLFRTLDTFPNV
jgi:hypothetical protein